jgi:Glycosyl hydrolases family 38 N-terminal domain/Alpha mannosidase middle domain/Glycosyl hydrolases family 38 C-terminal domain
MPSHTVHYVLSTHWDREWRWPFQEFRFYLVRLMDRVTNALDDGSLETPFHTDGQSIILEDYLEIAPDRQELVARLLCEGKLVSGPWYVMPDEFTVSGESLIRNLELGMAIPRSYGAQSSRAGLVCDMFGHISQLPQIFEGFELAGALLWRGTNNIDQAEFVWKGADGSEIVCHRFGERGYANYAGKVRRVFDRQMGFDRDRTAADLEEYLKAEAGRSETNTVLMFDGGDHQSWDEEVHAVVMNRMRSSKDPFHIKCSTLDEYMDEISSKRDHLTLLLEGELREPGRQYPKRDAQWVIPGVLSSRIDLKQSNHRCQTLLCRWAEPFAAMSSLLMPTEYPERFFKVAWKYLLQNHAHDSIDGCSVDQVHRDMNYRFDQCLQIAGRVTSETLSQIVASTKGLIGGRELRLGVFNPSVRPTNGVAQLTINVPSDWPTFNEFFGFEPKPAFRVFDPEGKEIPYQRLSQAMQRIKQRHRPTKFVEAYHTNDVEVAIELQVPAMGYVILSVRPGMPLDEQSAQDEDGDEDRAGGAGIAVIPTRYPDVPGLATSGHGMANELVDVQVSTGGQVTLTDKRNGEVYEDLLMIEDRADIGDGWYHGIAINDEIYESRACASEVGLVHDGPYQTTLSIRTKMHLPRRFDFCKMKRSDEREIIELVHLLTLRADCDVLRVKTSLYNTIEDHRMRVLFPTGAVADTYMADSAFDVITRPIALRQDNHLYGELEVETKPQQSWTAVYDGRRGLAVITSGLLESAVRDHPDRSIALTLFRGTRRTELTNGEPDGLLRRHLTFDYMLTPLAEEPDVIRLTELGQSVGDELRSVGLRAEDQAIHDLGVSRSSTASGLQLIGKAIVSSVRWVENSLEARLYNPLDVESPVQLNLAGIRRSVDEMLSCQFVELDGRPCGDPQRCKDILDITLPPKRIVTIRIGSNT